MSSVLQSWVSDLSMMQQTVLLTAVRGPDGVSKYGPTKMLLRWYRRCILLSAMDQRALTDPMELNGGSFTGPSILMHDVRLTARQIQDEQHQADFDQDMEDIREIGEPLVLRVDDDRDFWTVPIEEAIAYVVCHGGWERRLDEVVGNYLREIDAIPHHFQLHLLHATEIIGYKHPDDRIRTWWAQTYHRLVHDMHLWPETEEQLDRRLGDNREQWLERNDPATVE